MIIIIINVENFVIKIINLPTARKDAIKFPCRVSFNPRKTSFKASVVNG